MPETVASAAANMAAAFDTDAFARGLILGAEAAIRELTRMGMLPEKEQEAERK